MKPKLMTLFSDTLGMKSLSLTQQKCNALFFPYQGDAG